MARVSQIAAVLPVNLLLCVGFRHLGCAVADMTAPALSAALTKHSMHDLNCHHPGP